MSVNISYGLLQFYQLVGATTVQATLTHLYRSVVEIKMKAEYGSGGNLSKGLGVEKVRKGGSWEKDPHPWYFSCHVLLFLYNKTYPIFSSVIQKKEV